MCIKLNVEEKLKKRRSNFSFKKNSTISPKNGKKIIFKALPTQKFNFNNNNITPKNIEKIEKLKKKMSILMVKAFEVIFIAQKHFITSFLLHKSTWLY